MSLDNLPEMLTPREVGEVLRVDPKTVTRWANSGKIVHVRTPGGHRRYPREAVLRLFQQTVKP